MSAWIGKNKLIAVDKNTTITAAEYRSILKRNAKLEDKSGMQKKAMGVLVRE